MSCGTQTHQANEITKTLGATATLSNDRSRLIDPRGSPLSHPLVIDGTNQIPEDEEFDFGGITNAMKKINPKNKRWNAEVENFGWRKASGKRENFEAVDGEHLLSSILPNTLCNFNVYVDYRKREIKVQNYHHDNATGSEWYYIRPAK